MEIKILNSILFNELMPWTFDAKGTKAINEKLIKLGSKEPTSEAELVEQLQLLLSDYTDLSKWLIKQNTKEITTLKKHCFAIDFPDYPNAITKFYCKIISLETLRVYNAFNTKIQKYSNKVDIVYHTTIALKNIKALTQNTVKEIKQKGFEEAPNENSTLSHFVLQLLRQHLTVLFFDIQELSKASIDNPISIEDFYLIDLNLSKSASKEIKQKAKGLDTANKILSNNMLSDKHIDSASPKLSFGWKNGSKEQLQALFDDLCVDINFLDEQKTSVKTLVDLLTSKEIVPGAVNIYLACQTTEFVFVIDNLGKLFLRLTQTNIEKSLSFWSKEEQNKKPALISSTNFSKTRSKSKLKEEKKNEILATIYKYFQ